MKCSAFNTKMLCVVHFTFDTEISPLMALSFGCISSLHGQATYQQE